MADAFRMSSAEQSRMFHFKAVLKAFEPKAMNSSHNIVLHPDLGPNAYR
jgi:hypothetical protein